MPKKTKAKARQRPKAKVQYVEKIFKHKRSTMKKNIFLTPEQRRKSAPAHQQTMNAKRKAAKNARSDQKHKAEAVAKSANPNRIPKQRMARKTAKKVRKAKIKSAGKSRAKRKAAKTAMYNANKRKKEAQIKNREGKIAHREESKLKKMEHQSTMHAENSADATSTKKQESTDTTDSSSNEAMNHCVTDLRPKGQPNTQIYQRLFTESDRLNPAVISQQSMKRTIGYFKEANEPKQDSEDLSPRQKKL